MVVGALQQDGVPETVAYPQVDAHRGKHIRQHLLTACIDLNFFHRFDTVSGINNSLFNGGPKKSPEQVGAGYSCTSTIVL